MWEKKAILSVSSHRIQLWCYLRISKHRIHGRAEDPRFRKQQLEKMSLFNLNAVSLSVSLQCGCSLIAEEIYNHSCLLLSLSNQLYWEQPHFPRWCCYLDLDTGESVWAGIHPSLCSYLEQQVGFVGVFFCFLKRGKGNLVKIKFKG